MKKALLLLSVALATPALAQIQFDPSIDITNFAPSTVVLPPSPLSYQVLFIGGHHYTQTGTNDSTLAKQWHDFIGFTPDNTPGTQDLGWVTINHEMIQKDDKIGDGGGMTTFKVRRDPATDSLIMVPQTLADGRSGKFFNVDFSTITGETGMNCGGINGPDGRIWTAEEWFQGSNTAIYSGGNGFRDTTDYTISTTIAGDFNGQTIKRYENLNYMVEIDPKTGKAIRKQYNWGRAGFEGGAFLPDNKTVFLGIDATPAPWVKFVANTARDYTSGNLYVWKADGTWAQVDNTKLDTMLSLTQVALSKGAAMFNRIEWVAYNDGKVYMTETGRDNFGSTFINGAAAGGTIDNHWVEAARKRNPALVSVPDDSVKNYVRLGLFNDYYGRVLEFDPTTNQMSIFLEGGPFLPVGDPGSYPDKHLSNPDGLSFMTVGSSTYMVIQEDLNGRSFGRVPQGVNNSLCEMYIYDMSDPNPTVNKLIRISAVPAGAEVTGAKATPDGKTLLVNCQHPSSSNPFPYNNSLTYAITGWDRVPASIPDVIESDNGFTIYPNPTARELNFNRVTDVAIYNTNGQRMNVYRNVKSVDVSHLAPGTYFVQNAEGQTQKLIVQ